MLVRIPTGYIIVAISLCMTQTSEAIEITATQGGGPTPQQLAENIADQNGGVVVKPISTLTNINNSLLGNPPSDPRAMGTFTNGVTAPDTEFVNAGVTGTYAGGIAIDSGICLCTGVVSDALAAAQPGLGFGVEGPNNGDGEGIISNPPNPTENHTGEITTQLFGTEFADQDFEDLVFPNEDPGGGDATVLQFDVEISQPGFLRISFVFGSDEYPHYTNPLLFQFNDSVGIIINGENVATITMNEETTPFDLFEFSDCGPPLFFENNTAPAPAILTPQWDPPNLHAIPSAPRYNVEFGGFTKKLTREISCPLAPGTYTVKFVVQDVSDQRVDAAVFLEENGLKLFPLAAGDYNGDGIVDSADYSVWAAHFGQSPACFYDGDGNGNGTVDAADYVAWHDHIGELGNADLAGDLDRSGCVGTADLNIVLDHWQLPKCASRFEGDADGDGQVGTADLNLVLDHWGEGNCGQAMMAGGGGWEDVQAQLAAAGITVDVEQFAAAREELAGSDEASRSPSAADIARIPESPDLNGDGQVDAEEIARLTKIVYEAYFGASESPAMVVASDDTAVSNTDAGVVSASTPEPVQVLPQPESIPEAEFAPTDEAPPAEEAPAADEAPPVDEGPPTPPPGPFGTPLPVPPGAPR